MGPVGQPFWQEHTARGMCICQGFGARTVPRIYCRPSPAVRRRSTPPSASAAAAGRGRPRRPRCPAPGHAGCCRILRPPALRRLSQAAGAAERDVGVAKTSWKTQFRVNSSGCTGWGSHERPRAVRTGQQWTMRREQALHERAISGHESLCSASLQTLANVRLHVCERVRPVQARRLAHQGSDTAPGLRGISVGSRCGRALRRWRCGRPRSPRGHAARPPRRPWLPLLCAICIQL